jgi:hypothetical protein
MSSQVEETDMSDFIISPAGFLALPNWPTVSAGPTLRGVGQAATPYTVAPVQKNMGGSLIRRGLGETDLTSLNVPQAYGGVCGIMNAQVILPTAGTAYSLAFSVDNASTPLGYCGIYLDSSNRVGAKITDIYGNLVAAAVPSGAAGVAGTPAIIVFSWDARKPYVSLTVNGTSVPFTTSPTTAWTPFLPVALELGVGISLAALSPFPNVTGITIVQLAAGSPVAPVFPTPA